MAERQGSEMSFRLGGKFIYAPKPLNAFKLGLNRKGECSPQYVCGEREDPLKKIIKGRPRAIHKAEFNMISALPDISKYEAEMLKRHFAALENFSGLDPKEKLDPKFVKPVGSYVLETGNYSRAEPSDSTAICPRKTVFVYPSPFDATFEVPLPYSIFRFDKDLVPAKPPAIKEYNTLKRKYMDLKKELKEEKVKRLRFEQTMTKKMKKLLIEIGLESSSNSY